AFGHLLVPGPGGIGEYDPATGAIINPTFISGVGTPRAMTQDGNNHLFVLDSQIGRVGEFSATTGAVINANFITGLTAAQDFAYVAAVPEPSSLLLVAAAAGIAVG